MKYGQQTGREERIRRTAEWLNATPLQLHGDPLVMDPGRHYDRARELCATIRQLLQFGQVEKVVVQDANPLVLQHVRAILTSEELAYVSLQQ